MVICPAAARSTSIAAGDLPPDLAHGAAVREPTPRCPCTGIKNADPAGRRGTGRRIRSSGCSARWPGTRSRWWHTVAVAVGWSSDVLPRLATSLAADRRRPGLRGGPCSWDVCAVDQRADIVVAGAGHNSLIAACYLAKAGYRCLVLDARHVPGGGASTEEILLPGYGIDTCATGHTLI